MSSMDHRKLDAWRLARSLALETYRVSEGMQSDERFGLRQQMRRAAISVPSNLAEGAARGTPSELRRFAQISRGSLAELQTQLILCLDLGMLKDAESLEQIIDRLFKVLNGLIRHYR